MRKLLLIAALLAPFALPAQNNVQVYVTAEMGSSFAGGSIAAQQITPQGNGTPSLTFFFDASGNANGLNGMGLPGNGTWQFRFCQSTSNICYNAQIAFPGVPRFDATAIFTAAIISGGSGCTPGGVSGTVQVAGGGGTCAGGNINDAQTLPGAALVSESLSVLGPRPHVDVTAFGAKGNNTANDTLAIQSSINAACATSGIGGAIPAISFPPGVYLYTWPQVGSGATAAFTQPCPLRWEGNGQAFGGAQFVQSPAVWLVPALGANPANVPFLDLGDPNNESLNNGINSSYYGLTIEGYKKVFQVENSASISWSRVTASTATAGSNANGDCPYSINSSIFLDFDHTGYQTAGATGYGYCINDTNGTQPTGIITWKSSGLANVGCGIYYNNGANLSSAAPGNWEIDSMQAESCPSDFISINNSNGFSLSNFNRITIKNSQSFDSPCGTCALINFNVPGTGISSVIMENDFIQGDVALRVTAGVIQDYHNTCGASFCANIVVDTNNNATGTGQMNNNSGGMDFVGIPLASTVPGIARSELSFSSFGTPYPASRWFLSGKGFASLAIDAGFGHAFGNGLGYGFDESIVEPSQGVLNIDFASTYPPTSVTASAGSAGGTLAAGTYVYNVRSSNSANCSNNSSAPSLTSNSVTISANTQINLSWSLPTAGVNAIAGFCVMRQLGTVINPTGPSGYYFVSGATTTTYTDTNAAFTSAGQLSYQNVLKQVSFFTPTGLTVPNLTITGTCTGCGISFGGTPGIIPVFTGSFPFLTNSSPQLDLTTHSLGLTFAGAGGLFVPNGPINTNMTGGPNCVHETAGVLSATSGDCSTGGTVLNSGAFTRGEPIVATSTALTVQTVGESTDCIAYGVVGNGSTDDTAAMQACANAVPVGGGTLRLPADLAVFMTLTNGLPITFPHTPVIVDCSAGANYGAAATYFETNTASYLFRVGTINNGSAQQQGVIFRGCGFQDSSASHNTALGGILFSDVNNSGLENNAFYNFNRPSIATPAAPSISVGSGSTNYWVQIVCTTDMGGHTIYSPEQTATSGSTTLTVTAPTSSGCPAPSSGYQVLASTSGTGLETLQASSGCTLNASGTACGLTNNWSGTVGAGTLPEAFYQYDTSAGAAFIVDGQTGANGTAQDASYGHFDDNTFQNTQECMVINGGIQEASNNHLSQCVVYGLLTNRQNAQVYSNSMSIEIPNTTTARGIILNGTSPSHIDAKFEGTSPGNTNITCAEVNSSRNYIGGNWTKCGVRLVQENAGVVSNTYDIHLQVSNNASPLISTGFASSDIIFGDTLNGGPGTILPDATISDLTTGNVCALFGHLQTTGCGAGSGTTTIANGTAALGTSAIASAACATVVTVSATGVATTDNIMADFNADPTSTVGYIPSASGMLTIIKYPTTNNVNFKVCNNTGGSITPGAVTLNWRVTR